VVWAPRGWAGGGVEERRRPRRREISHQVDEEAGVRFILVWAARVARVHVGAVGSVGKS